MLLQYKLQLWLAFIAGIISCNKPNLEEKGPIPPIYHIQFVDYNSGKSIAGLRLDAGYFYEFNSEFRSDTSLYTDVNGSTHIQPNGSYSFQKVISNKYIDAIYTTSIYNDSSNPRFIYPNTINTRLSNVFGQQYYFKAELYRKAAVELHFIQTSDFSSDSIRQLTLQTKINATLPTAPHNFFESSSFSDIKLDRNRKLDTTILLHGIGETTNWLSWEVFYIDYVGRDAWGPDNYIPIRIAGAVLPKKIYASDSTTKITITF
jgi:hypothetical protein